jgi:hypothetical protein
MCTQHADAEAVRMAFSATPAAAGVPACFAPNRSGEHARLSAFLYRMPKFYFHLHNSLDVSDREGGDYDDLASARAAAAFQARALASELVKEDGRIVLRHRIDIENADGAVLDSVSFGDVVRVEE